MMSPKNFIGRAEEQTEEFLRDVIQPILEEYKEALGMEGDVSV